MTHSADVDPCEHVLAVDVGFVELSWAHMAVLGVIQGITELLPISSTAHLRVIPGILGWRDPGTAFSAAMQLASFAAVIAYFRKDIGSLGSATLRAAVSRKFDSSDFRVVLGILLGTIPLLVAGALLRPVLNGCHSPLRGLLVVGSASIAMSVLLGIAEKFARHRRTFGQITLRDGIIVGLAQAFALVPGVSRSGATLTAGLFCGMERETAARFSFLLGLPAVTLAGLYELRVLFKAGLSSDGWITLLIGLSFASVTAFIAIYALLRYLERRSTWIFVWYRLMFGAAIVAAVAAGYLRN
ncbi:MAG TPA: undecaprenyl-diphosphate phosphatase [Steroidobacteraceae bacterium]|nr:undecaprenyl-diphosphate phosphatase [Steroidobacteraceae bacterium]